ncbi:MAG: efflux RND transporter periplasmic adaptor subunit [Smithella sp.]
MKTIHLMKKNDFRFFGISIAVFILILIFVGCKKKKPVTMPPPIVEVAEVIQRDVPVKQEWIGTTDGFVNAVIRPQVTGYLIKQEYKEGDFVRKGQVLFQVDPRPFKASLRQALGTLGQARAQHANTKATLTRIKPLAEENAVSQKDLDDAIGAERSSFAAVKAAQAAVENARLNLDFTKITSLIDGIAGLARQQVGDLIGPNLTGELTTVSTINPIKVYFSESEQAFTDFIKKISYGEKSNQQDQKLNIELLLPDGSIYPHEGKFYAADRQVNTRTGTLRMAALFPNPQGFLRPGQFVRIIITAGIKKNALLIPQRAVAELQQGYQVAVVGPNNLIEMRQVKPSERIGELWVIDSGKNAGERIVAEGVQKVKQGMPVNPRPFIPTFRQSSPEPQKSGIRTNSG